MIPGELFVEPGTLSLNAGREKRTFKVANTGDRRDREGRQPDIQLGAGIVIGPGTEVIAGEGLIVTACGIDSHIHFICPPQHHVPTALEVARPPPSRKDASPSGSILYAYTAAAVYRGDRPALPGEVQQRFQRDRLSTNPVVQAR